MHHSAILLSQRLNIHFTKIILEKKSCENYLKVFEIIIFILPSYSFITIIYKAKYRFYAR